MDETERDQARPLRRVLPRRSLLAGAAAVTGTAAFAPRFALAQGEGEGEGEGGGEGEGEGGGSSGTPEIAFLSALGLVEGHLLAGATLYADGAAEHAVTHMKHPGDEIYGDLEPMIERFGAPGFAAELEALAAAVEGGAPADDVAAAHQAVEAKIAEARAAAQASPYQQAKSVQSLLQTAAEEYAIGIVDGQVDNLHEYQDAWGFVQIASARTGEIDMPDEVRQRITAAMEPVDALFPSIMPEGGVDAEADTLYGAAARVDLAANRLQ